MITPASRIGTARDLRLYALQYAAGDWQRAHPGKTLANFLFGEIPFAWRNVRVEAEAQSRARRLPGGYPPSAGAKVVREAVARDLQRAGMEGFDPNNVVITNGALEAIFLGMLAVVNPGDEVIIPDPSYFNYDPQSILAGGRPVHVQTRAENGFKLTADELAAAISPRTKVLVLNSPLNPVGSAYGAGELRGLSQVLQRHADILVVCDEVYDRIYLDGQAHVNLWAVAPELRDRVVVCNSLAKSTGLAELRAGWMAAPPAIARLKMKGPINWVTSVIAQEAILAALDDETRFNLEVEIVRQKLRAGRGLMLGRLSEMGIACPEAGAGLFVFPKIPDNFCPLPAALPDGAPMSRSEQFARFLLDFGILVVPGIDHGIDGHFRLTFALETGAIVEGMDRFQEALVSIG